MTINTLELLDQIKKVAKMYVQQLNLTGDDFRKAYSDTIFAPLFYL